jgi:hypothetical protein
VDSILKKFGVFIPILLTIVLAFSIVPNVNAATDIIYSDSEDGIVGSSGFVNTDVLNTGDFMTDYYTRGFVKFSLSGVSGSVSSATLNLYLHSSFHDGALDQNDPLTNPGLGDLQVIHIDDYGILSDGDFNDPSIGNDPGVLISGSATPDRGYYSIDITAAMQDDIDNGRAFTSFLIKLATNTDSDNQADVWNIRAYQGVPDQDPYIEYTIVGPVGGIYAPTSKLTLLAPFIALVGLIGAISTIFAIRRWRKN